MKKIFFIMKYPTCLIENLVKKFEGQMNACVHLGYEVWYLEWDGRDIYLVCKNKKYREKVLSCRTLLGKEKYYHSQYFLDLYKASYKVLKSMEMEYVYIRHMPFLGSVISMVKKLGTAKFIMEIPTYPIEDELKKEKRIIRKWAFLVSKHYENRLMLRVDLLTICGEKINGELQGKKAINIINGIDVDKLPVRIPRLHENEVHILLLASMCYWQAYDRIIEALKNYKSKNIVKLHFVGSDGDGSLKKWEELTQEYGMTEYVFFHGAKYGEKLDKMFNMCDIGVGTLGLYRKKSNEGATLKVREYMSRGLPFIYAGNDQAITRELPFALQVANDDTPLDMEVIVDFAMRFKHNESISLDMREYAKMNMTWEKEFKKIFDSIE